MKTKPEDKPLAEFIPKPASVLYEEFNKKLIDLVNLSGLPKFCLVPVLDDVLKQVREAAVAEYKRDFESWQEKFKQAPCAETEKPEGPT